MKPLVSVLLLFLLNSAGADTQVQISCAVGDDPYSQAWCQKAKVKLAVWSGVICTVLSPDGDLPKSIYLSSAVVHGTSYPEKDEVVVGNQWISKNAGNVGLAIHELVHVYQDYPDDGPIWITEGIADYFRWVLYEGKELDWFPINRDAHGYTEGDAVTAGFFLWLESVKRIGTVKQLHWLMKNGSYSDEAFEHLTGETLSNLWREYQQSRAARNKGARQERVARTIF